MTSRQLQAKLDAALAVLAQCEDVFLNPEKAVRRGAFDRAASSVLNFMEQHRDDLVTGGQP